MSAATRASRSRSVGAEPGEDRDRDRSRRPSPSAITRRQHGATLLTGLARAARQPTHAPPFWSIACPVTPRASGESSHATVPATSSGCPIRPERYGASSRRRTTPRACRASRRGRCQAMSVSIQPGQIAFTCTFSRRELGGEGAHEPEQPRLRRGVAGVVRHRDPRQDRRDHDEMARVRARLEVALRGAEAPVRAGEVRRDEVVPAVALPGLVRAAEPGDGDEAEERPVRGRRGGEGAVDRLAVADVDGLDVPASGLRRRSPRAPRASAPAATRRAPSAASRSAIARPIPRDAPETATCLPSNRRCLPSANPASTLTNARARCRAQATERRAGSMRAAPAVRAARLPVPSRLTRPPDPALRPRASSRRFPTRPRRSSLDAEQLGWNDVFAGAFAPHEQEGLIPGRVAVQHRGGYVVLTEDGELEAEAARRLVRSGELAAVGDWVALRLLPRRPGDRRGGAAAADGVQPQGRRMDRTGEQIVAANVDTVFLVVGARRTTSTCAGSSATSPPPGTAARSR